MMNRTRTAENRDDHHQFLRTSTPERPTKTAGGQPRAFHSSENLHHYQRQQLNRTYQPQSTMCCAQVRCENRLLRRALRKEREKRQFIGVAYQELLCSYQKLVDLKSVIDIPSPCLSLSSTDHDDGGLLDSRTGNSNQQFFCFPVSAASSLIGGPSRAIQQPFPQPPPKPQRNVAQQQQEQNNNNRTFDNMAMSDDDDDGMAQLDHQNEHDHPVVGQFVPERPPPPVAIQSLSGINTIGGDHQTVENGNQHPHQQHHQAVLRPKTTSIAGGNRQQTINFDDQPEQPPKNRDVQKEEAAKQQQRGGGPSVDGGQPMVVKSATTTNSSSKMRYKAIEQRNQQKVRAIKHTVVVPTVKPVATKPVRAAPPPPPPHKVASFPLAVRGRDPLQNVSKNTATEGQQQNVIIRKPPPATTVGHPNAGKHPTRAHGIVATNKAPVASNKGGEKRDHQNLPPPTRQNQQQQNKIILLSDDDYEAEEAEEQLGIRRAIDDDDSIVETVLRRRRGLGRQTANSYFIPFDENIGGDGGRYQTNREANLAAERNLRRFLTRSRARVQAIVDASRKRATIAAHRRAVITDLLKGKRVMDDEVMSVLCTDSSKVLAFPSFMDRMRRASKRAYDKSPVRQKQEEERERALQGATNRIMAHSSAAITRMLAKAHPNRRPKFLHRSPTPRQKQEAEHEHALQRATNRIMAHSSSVINQMLAKAHLTNKHNGDDDQ